MLDREQLIEIVVSVSAVLAMLGTMIWIGTTYGDESGVLQSDGGELLVYTIIGFIILMTVIGILLAFVLNDPSDEIEDDSDDLEAQNAY
ncbi:DUF7472 family protein [Natronolimnobius baerhuensis]|uniref:Uncharacterized protein n=1 Tax=Natronolimnobius baerhuensis TaxID=253108 RepID=A0A202E5B0_9EURY|nr:hypothetical protein [Natronolimnobius baerhuensis]OVE83427.1 hypothetical protein B2G88_13330 [Natronolimnobius baerhuensis]